MVNMKAIVFGHERGGTYVMDREGTFRFIHGYTSQPIGSEIKIKDKPPINLARIASIAACLILVISFSLIALMWNLTSHYVYVDINPSIELQFNRFDRLRTANPLDENGAMLLDGLRLRGSADDIVVALINEAKEKNFIDTIDGEQVVLVTVVSISGRSTEAQETAISLALENQGMLRFTIVESCDMENRDKAERLGVSPGRLRLAEEAMRTSDGQTTLDELLRKRVGDLLGLIESQESGNDQTVPDGIIDDTSVPLTLPPSNDETNSSQRDRNEPGIDTPGISTDSGHSPDSGQPRTPRTPRPPQSNPPTDIPPDSAPPVTEPPVTEPPRNEPPVTEPPVTEPPVTEPPVTEPPSDSTCIDCGNIDCGCSTGIPCIDCGYTYCQCCVENPCGDCRLIDCLCCNHPDALIIFADDGARITVRLVHLNNTGRFFIINIRGVTTELLTRAGTFTETVHVDAYEITIRVQGNDLISATARNIDSALNSTPSVGISILTVSTSIDGELNDDTPDSDTPDGDTSDSDTPDAAVLETSIPDDTTSNSDELIVSEMDVNPPDAALPPEDEDPITPLPPDEDE